MGSRAKPDMAIHDSTDDEFQNGQGESLEKRISSICATMARRIEALADSVAHGCSARTEQGIPFQAFANGLAHPEGAMIPVKLVAGDMGADAQIRALQECAEETFEAVLAAKPVDTDLLIWREEPQASRSLYPEGLHLQIYTRLAWDKLRERRR